LRDVDDDARIVVMSNASIAPPEMTDAV